MLCAISGVAPQVPVASRKSGNVFEKRLIEAHIAESQTDPVTGEELSVDDLIELKSAPVVTARPPSLTSIPALLSAFQTEWDALLLESYALKKQLALTTQELSAALYANDAATRVIARLSQERDEAREALSNGTIRERGATSNGDAMQIDSQGLPDDLVAKVDEAQQQLFGGRRKRHIPDGWATADNIASLHVTSSTDALFLDSPTIVLDESGDLALFGGANGVASVYSLSQQKVLHALQCGSAVTATLWWQSRAIVATSAGTIKVFDGSNEVAELGSHAGQVTSIALHPSGAILASTGIDKYLMFYDLSSFKVVSRVYTEAAITCCAFHVDGLLFFTGSPDERIRIYDVKNGTKMADLETGGAVHSISFSENGTWFAVTQTGSSTVSVWDLRKQAVIKVLDVGSPVNNIHWDYTGQFLATAGSGCVSVQQYTKSSKSWSEPVRKAVPARDVAWGSNASVLVVLSPEGALSILSGA
ncbi:WD40 repeat-like protein [Lindgomyces ingoldianus]|uniref:WD40 repeat-like protein n=1 Tax=Lindgomyces ingoldianus TaxID=673940 RepID=A0ACB6QPS5_9PLEO|nr:WD40 repeat-like protein [Lindgomyces ingoldianus]KAF2468984.1 WD40 repeat-like protein [Lindgomyces ingoldianus]